MHIASGLSRGVERRAAASGSPPPTACRAGRRGCCRRPRRTSRRAGRSGSKGNAFGRRLELHAAAAAAERRVGVAAGRCLTRRGLSGRPVRPGRCCCRPARLAPAAGRLARPRRHPRPDVRRVRRRAAVRCWRAATRPRSRACRQPCAASARPCARCPARRAARSDRGCLGHCAPTEMEQATTIPTTPETMLFSLNVSPLASQDRLRLMLIRLRTWRSLTRGVR